MKINKKGFTLIELLIVIAVVSLVLAVGTYFIIGSIKKSKEKAYDISFNSIKESARVYSTEATDESWKVADDDHQYFCVTIGELINKGLLKKDEVLNKNYGFSKSDFAVISRNINTMVIDKEDVITDKTITGSNKEVINNLLRICNGDDFKENITNPSINEKNSYTDTITFNFNDAIGESSIINRVCYYGESSTNTSNEGIVDGNECIISGLISNKNYYAKICMETEMNSTACSNIEDIKTKELIKPIITVPTNIFNSKVEITYSSAHIYKEEASYYFKSTINGNSNVNVQACSLNDRVFSCGGDNTTNISANTWYKLVSGKSILLDYGNNNTSNSGTIEAITTDKSNNEAEITKNINIYIVNFNRNAAESITDTVNNQTGDSLRLMCVAEENKSCKIKTPIITREGWVSVGYGDKTDSTSNILSHNSELTMTNSTPYNGKTYYAITKKNVTIYYDGNGINISKGNISYNETINCSNATSCTSTCDIYNNSSKCMMATPNILDSSGSYTYFSQNKESNNFIDGNDLYKNAYFATDDSKNGKTYYVPRKDAINDIRYNGCKVTSNNKLGTDVIYVTDCGTLTTSNCKFTTLNGFVNNGTVIRGNISQFSSLNSDCKANYYVSSSGLNCRSSASSTSNLVKTYPCGTALNLARTTEVINNENSWYYVPSDKCYVSGEYLQNSSPNCNPSPGGGSSSGGGQAFCGSCSRHSDCAGDMTCTGICTRSSGSYNCCVATGNAQCS